MSRTRSSSAFLVRALCALAGWLLPAAASAADPERAAQPGIYRIQATDIQLRTASGTAVLVAARTLVTNCHVVLDAPDIVVFDGVTSHPADVVRADVEHDLCLLVGPALDAPLATLGDTRRLLPGAAIAAAGYSTGGALTRSTGQIEGLFSYNGNGRVIQGSAPFDAGASGGGLFDDSGRLVGILTFKARAGGPFHFAVPVEWVMDLLANNVTLPRNGATAAFWQHTDDRRPAFLRAATLAARGDCAALAEAGRQWVKQEPGNPEAGLISRNLLHCYAGTARIGH